MRAVANLESELETIREDNNEYESQITSSVDLEKVRHIAIGKLGSGYPNRLSGKDTPYLARIIAVADSIDAMSSDRCYRKALPWSVCVDEIIKNRGKMYDPDVVSAFDSCKHEIMAILTRL